MALNGIVKNVIMSDVTLIQLGLLSFNEQGQTLIVTTNRGTNARKGGCLQPDIESIFT